VEIEFLGAARQVTGSCHIVRANQQTVLLDCGLFQGHRQEADAANRQLPVPTSQISSVVVSHAHLDHTGRLPLLTHQGYKGPIYMTPATRDLSAVLLQDSASIQESDAAFLKKHKQPVAPPLYNTSDVAPTLALVRQFPYGTWFDVVPSIRARYSDAGHILGSASITLEVTEGGATKRVVFSGDIGRSGQAIITDPVPPSDGADLVIMESTYGDRDHPSVASTQEQLGQAVRDTATRGGRVLIPAFALGRAQEIIYDLHVLTRAGKIPQVPIVVDSPLATQVTKVFEAHPELFDHVAPEMRQEQSLFHFNSLRFTESVDDSKKLNTASGPMVIIAGSGMAESGRILHHLLHGASDPRNTILIVGFQADGTLGRRIAQHQSPLRIFDERVQLKAQVQLLSGYSAHADRTELGQWLDAVHQHAPSLRQVCLVHGEPPEQAALTAQLSAKGYTVSSPSPGTRITI
jgi:metallo-beta-lactamase family protein